MGSATGELESSGSESCAMKPPAEPCPLKLRR
jgi:hypothetical protein